MKRAVFKGFALLILSCFHYTCAIDHRKAVSSVLPDRQFLTFETVYGSSSSEDGSKEWNRTMRIVRNDVKRPSLDYSIDWSSTVFMIFMYENDKVDRLIDAHFSTWLKHIGEGADIVYITDVDDSRSFDEILPDADKIKATCHLFKSQDKNDGKRLRFKVVDGFQRVNEAFQEKKYFFKIDSDTYLVAESLLAYVNDLHERTYPKPVLFGYANCLLYCYADGGFYGFNDIGFSAVNQYLKDHPDITNSKRNRLESHEDAMVSYAYREATMTPVIHNPFIITHRKWISIEKGISFHKVLFSFHFYDYEKRFYFFNGTKRGLIT